MTDLIDTVRSITKSASDLGNDELYADLQKLSKQAFKLIIENLKLKQENKLLKEQNNNDAKKQPENDCYYFADEGLYCTRCYDVDNRKVHLIKKDIGKNGVYFSCPICKAEVYQDGKLF